MSMFKIESMSSRIGQSMLYNINTYILKQKRKINSQFIFTFSHLLEPSQNSLNCPVHWP